MTRTVTYSIVTDGSVISDPNELARVAEADVRVRAGIPRRAAGQLHSRRVAGRGGDFDAGAGEPNVERYDPVCSFLYSCTVGRDVVINDLRFAYRIAGVAGTARLVPHDGDQPRDRPLARPRTRGGAPGRASRPGDANSSRSTCRGVRPTGGHCRGLDPAAAVTAPGRRVGGRPREELLHRPGVDDLVHRHARFLRPGAAVRLPVELAGGVPVGVDRTWHPVASTA